MDERQMGRQQKLGFEMMMGIIVFLCSKKNSCFAKIVIPADPPYP